MKRRKAGAVLAGAVAGIWAGVRTSPASADDSPAVDKHLCKGLNDCKGKGNCKHGCSGHGCAGKNDCKSKGGCAAEAAHHKCSGKNECKTIGGCAAGDQGCAGKNTCKGKGGCEVPLKIEHAKDRARNEKPKA